MDAFSILGVSVGIGTVAEPSDSLSSVAGFQERLRNEFTNKVTEKSAQHITEVFELRPSVVFDIPVSEPENETLENAASVDPLLGGVRSSVALSVQGAGQTVRRVNAIDALTNQPVDHNAVQNSVAKYIVSLIAEVDGSSWAVREVQRGDQGWTFTYVCKDSLQVWQRQTAKTPAKVPIGAWSGKDSQDPVNMARPSFDCRGHVTVAFVKTRKIEIKYEHIPMHKSVAQLMEILVPEPPEPVAPPVANKKAPKEPKTPKVPKAPRPRKRQTNGDAAEKDGSQPKKRHRMKAADAVPAEMTGVVSADGHQPEGSANGANGAVPHTTIPQVSEEEAARRSDYAIQLLTGKGIDLETLSTEQFNIFSNQSPDLQQESLAMLVRYGAERLRIVHPNKNGTSSGEATPSPEQPVNLSGSPSATPSKPERSWERKSAAAPAEDASGLGDGHVSAAAATLATGRAKFTRGACESCRGAKAKCDKSKPSCTQCLNSEIVCEYALAKPRASRASKVTSEETGDEEQEAGGARVVDEQQDDEPESLGSPGFHNDHNEQPGITQTDLVPHPVVETPSAAFNHDPFDHEPALAYPSATLPVVPEIPQHTSIASTSTDYGHNPVANTEPTANEYTYPPPAQTSNLSFLVQPDLSNVQTHSTDLGHQRTRSRRALPTTPTTQNHSAAATTTTAQLNGWQAMSNSPTVTPVSTNIRSPRQTRSQAVYNTAPRAHDNARQQSDWSAASQPTQQATNPSAYKPPSLATAQTARVKSRQAMRNQSSTPVQNVQTNRQPAQASPTYPATSGVSNPTAVSNYDYSQYSAARGESNNTVAYEPYSNHPVQNATSNSYNSYYGTRSAAVNASATAASTDSQTVASSYNSTTATAPSTSQQWGAVNNPSAQSRNAHGYNTTQSSTSASYDRPSTNTQSSSTLQGFNVRPQSTTQTRSSSNAYAHQQAQQAQQQRSQQTQQQQNYNGYSNQPQATNNQQENWYGFNAANNPSPGYNTAATNGNNAYPGGSSHAHGGSSGGGAYNQTPHRSMDLSGHTYSSMPGGGEQALYELLRSNHGS